MSAIRFTEQYSGRVGIKFKKDNEKRVGVGPSALNDGGVIMIGNFKKALASGPRMKIVDQVPKNLQYSPRPVMMKTLNLSSQNLTRKETLNGHRPPE